MSYQLGINSRKMLHAAAMQCTRPATPHMQSHSTDCQLQGLTVNTRRRHPSELGSMADELMVED